MTVSVEAADVEVTLTGRARLVNGEERVPRPLFGVHATPLTPEQRAAWGVESVRVIQRDPGAPAGPRADGIAHIVECFYDRFQPALIVQHADWADRLGALARRYGEAARALQREAIVEFWNEPYLNWGVQPGVNYDGAFYRAEGRAPGAPMTLHYETEPSPWLVWARQRVAVVPNRGTVDYVATRFMPPGLAEGATFVWRNQTYRVEERWWGRDRTQHSFWPGRQNVEWYNRMLRVFAPALKEANPRVTLIGGWDFHIHQNGYAAWEDVHRPTLDAGLQWLDGYTEHHYGGDTRAVAASYETAVAYAALRHGRRIRIWNTEAGGELDPEQPGVAPPGYNRLQGLARDRGGLVYFVRDILHLLDACPDKAAARAAHEAHLNRGVIAGFRLLKPLRGRLMEARSGHPDVWAVSALEDGRWTLALYNDGAAPHRVRVRLIPPAGARIGSAEELVVGDDFEVQARAVSLEAASSGGGGLGAVELRPREARVWVVTLEGAARPTVVEERQYFADAIVQRLKGGADLSWKVTPEPAALARAESAFLRVCARGWNPATHELTVNGRPISVDAGRSGIQDIPLAAGIVAPETVIRVRTAENAPEMLLENISLWLRLPAGSR